jgi:hypothetical protein
VAAVLRDPGQALFLVPESADELTQRVGWEARDLRLATLQAGVPLDDLVERAAAHFLPLISAARDRSP